MRCLRKYFKDFLLRGLISMGFGPIVLAIIYAILDLNGIAESVSVAEMVRGIISMSALAFLAGGINVVYQIEELSLFKAIAAHGIVLYLAYVVVYITNNWIKDGLIPFIIFTVIFVLGYAIVWAIIYLINKNKTDQINKKLKS